MVKIIKLKVSTLERWKRLLAYARATAFSLGDRETAELIRKVWADIEAMRARGDEDAV